MLTIGLIGGLSWYSTVEYYRVINELVQQRRGGGHASAEIAMVSLDFEVVRAQQEAADWAAAGALLADAGRRCEAAGADFVLICSNLMHKVADDVSSAISIPLLHVADSIADRALSEGRRTVGLLGTRGVMEDTFYIDRLRTRGLEVLVPDSVQRMMVDRVIFDELTQGCLELGSRTAYLDVVASLRDRGADAVVLGCTEIEHLLAGVETSPLLDSMHIHATHAVETALAGQVGQLP